MNVQLDLRMDNAAFLAWVQGLPSLGAYLVFAQNAPKAWAWIRGATGFSPGPQTFEGDAVIEVPVLAVTLPLAEIHAGILSGGHQ